MTDRRHQRALTGRRRHQPAAPRVALALLLAAGLALSACGGTATVDPPAAAGARPRFPVETPEPLRAAVQAASRFGARTLPAVQPAAPRPTSPPVALRIERIGVQTFLTRLGLAADGTLEVPEGKEFDLAGWYEGGPAPGATGPAVIAGHVDSATGPSVFFRLDELAPGDLVEVLRADGSFARFRVERTERYAKDQFPADRVYAPTPAAELRLITCGGDFDTSERSYRDNVVVFASST